MQLYMAKKSIEYIILRALSQK